MLPGSQAHLHWPLPLVIDLDAGLLDGWPTGGDDFDPARLSLSRPGWDLVRLHKRFRARILLLSSAPPDRALWVAGVLGLDRALVSMRTGSGAAEMAQVVTEHFPRAGYDYLGNAASVATVGAGARRVWLVGRQVAGLRGRLLTGGGQLVTLDPEDRFPLEHLVGAGGGVGRRRDGRDSGWDADATGKGAAALDWGNTG